METTVTDHVCCRCNNIKACIRNGYFYFSLCLSFVFWVVAGLAGSTARPLAAQTVHTMHLEFNTEIDLISDHFTDFLLIKNYNWHFGGLLVMLLDEQTKTEIFT